MSHHLSRSRAARRLAALCLFCLLQACGGPPSAPSAIGPVADPAADAAANATLQEARSLLGSQDFAGAVSLLEGLTSRQPDNAQARMLLGLALHRAGRLDEALAVHAQVAASEETAARGLYNGAATLALQGKAEEAFEWLGRLYATGQFDMSQIPLNPDFASIKNDPRIAAFLPTAEEFADPFVEPVRVLHEWVAEAPGDAFGWIARNVGDVDRDDVADLATSAPNFGEQAGKIYVYSGRSGALLWSATGEAGAQLGRGIEAAGDTDGDGVPDVIAGAPGLDRAYVYSGKDGSVLLTLVAAQDGETFGNTVADVGDLDGDGHDDVLVGAPGNDTRGENAGRAGVYSGKDGSLLFEVWGEEAGDGFGSSGGGARWAGGQFVMVGAPGAGEGDRGRVYVYRDGQPAPAFVIDAEESGARLGGMFVSVVGDVDGDGSPDVYGADWADSGTAVGAGRIYVHSGATGGRLLTLAGEAAGDGFGIGPADAGDVDGDGHDDLIVGAWQQGNAAPAAGKVYLYSGKDGKLLRAITCKVPGDTFGFDATGLGDIDGDGRIDYLLTSAWSAIRGPRSGRMFVIAG